MSANHSANNSLHFADLASNEMAMNHNSVMSNTFLDHSLDNSTNFTWQFSDNTLDLLYHSPWDLSATVTLNDTEDTHNSPIR